jgi:hypothetical protein
MRIKINAVEYEVSDQPLSYETIVDLADTRWGKATIHTVCYVHKVPFDKLPGERTGMLIPGQSVIPSEGMVIDAVVTGNA